VTAHSEWYCQQCRHQVLGQQGMLLPAAHMGCRGTKASQVSVSHFRSNPQARHRPVQHSMYRSSMHSEAHHIYKRWAVAAGRSRLLESSAPAPMLRHGGWGQVSSTAHWHWRTTADSSAHCSSTASYRVRSVTNYSSATVQQPTRLFSSMPCRHLTSMHQARAGNIVLLLVTETSDPPGGLQIRHCCMCAHTHRP
jgi:hypothetical protein